MAQSKKDWECRYRSKENKNQIICENVTDANIQQVAKNVNATTESLKLIGNLTVFGNYFLLPSLKTLNLDGNKLISIPKNLSVMFVNLETLRLNVNKIKELSSDNFEGLNKLKNFYLNDNELERLNGGAFQSLGNLIHLELNNNNLQELDEHCFKGLQLLQNLKLNYNKLSTLTPGIFDYFVKGINIEIKNNRIKSIPNGLFNILKSVSTFDLSNNSISAIGTTAFQNVSIDINILENNNISTVPGSSFKNVTTNYMSFSGNPLNCDCDMTGFFINLAEKPGNYPPGGKCKKPTNKFKKDIAEFIYHGDSTNGKTLNATTIRNTLCTGCDLNNRCLNNAVCIPVNHTKTSCNCIDNFSGELCELAPVCLNKPCKNNGVCSRTGNDTYRCKCSSWWYGGVHCEVGKTTTVILIIAGVVIAVGTTAVVAFLAVRHSRNKNNYEKPQHQNEAT